MTALRLLAAALVIFAAAGPIWNPQTGLAGSKAPLMIMLDDGWSAASNWDTRIRAADELIANADNFSSAGDCPETKNRRSSYVPGAIGRS